MTSDFLVPFRTAYTRPHIPKGCRLIRVEFPQTGGGAIVRQISRDDAPVAFRIVYPSDGQRFSRIPASAVEILSFAGRLWWPHGETRFGDRRTCTAIVHPSNSADEWRDQISTRRDLLRILPRGVEAVETETLSRVDIPDDSGEVTAQVQRTLFEDYIVCDGSIYAAGGVPVHALWRHASSCHVTVVGSGVDRRVSNFSPLRAYPGFFERPETQRTFAEGEFWLPGKLIAANLIRSRRSFPEIQIFAPEFVPRDLSDRIQIDGLFRRTMLSLDWLLFHTAVPGCEGMLYSETCDARRNFGSQVRSVFWDAVEPAADDYVTNKNRLDALRSLYFGERKVPNKHRRTIDALERSFRQLDTRNPVEELASDDLEALARLTN
jgi:hypothetical protein